MSMMFATEEEQAKHAAWLATVKAGHEVAVRRDHRGSNEPQYEKVAVKAVTPAGKIRLVDGALFDKDGERRVGESWGAHWEYLEPWTEEIEKLLARRKLVGQVGYYLDFSNVSREKLDAATDEDLVALRDILRKYRAEK